jgi:hypothetical protein
MRHSIAGLVVIATAIVGACANPPAPTPSAGPAASPSNGPAALTVTASGMVGCATEGGCQASIELDPSIAAGATLPPEWQAIGGWRFALAPVPQADFHTLGVGAGVGIPSTIAPGHYRVIGAVSGLSDVVGSPGPNILFTQSRCETDLTVGPATTVVSIEVVFGIEGPCVIAAAAA